MDSTNACGDFGINGDISMIFFGIPVIMLLLMDIGSQMSESNIEDF